ncbi:DUF4019 domain-containing protein [Bordetella bronchialis]|uniref:DUF4019 domain-containing protein n=1 Tax=Bordetella bronchialis TaxID=463025 RepID=A0ABN4R4L5_9BORD|nr:DUF4019 domain-containing protein [Bordetella bronchialis]ANN68145.1 hypothetical protein BAU06_19225 [Bordetella bronchialis]
MHRDMLGIRLILAIAIWATALAPALATDLDDAQNAASQIREAVRQQQYNKLWEQLTSEYFKSITTKSYFVDSLKAGYAAVGAPVSVKNMSHTFMTTMPGLGFKGKFYYFDYYVKYAKAAFFERVVVMEDPDGEYRLAGLWATAAP